MFFLERIIEFTWLAKNYQREAKDRIMMKKSVSAQIGKHKQWSAQGLAQALAQGQAQGLAQEPDQEDPTKDHETFDYLQYNGLAFYNLFGKKTHSRCCNFII